MKQITDSKKHKFVFFIHFVRVFKLNSYFFIDLRLSLPNRNIGYAVPLLHKIDGAEKNTNKTSVPDKYMYPGNEFLCNCENTKA